MRTLLVKDGDGDFRVQIPDDSTVTFGYSGSSSHYSLRVYEGHSKDKLLAVFGGVQQFRDVTLNVERLIVRESGHSVWKSDETGYKVEAATKREKSWEDELPRLTGHVVKPKKRH